MTNIIRTFENIVEKNKSRVAVISNNCDYTYEQLDLYSNFIAHKLKRVAQNGDRIGICIERSFTLIAAILGVLKAGMTYVPLDMSYPNARLHYMCEAASVVLVVCKKESAYLFGDNTLILDTEKYCLEDFTLEESKEAYIIFTSGSTGHPKGVSVSHESIMNTLLWRIHYYKLSNKDRVLQIPSVSYSSSVEDIFSTLLSGGALIMISQTDLLNVKKMGKLIAEHQVTHLLLIPTLYNELIPYLSQCSLRFVVVAGEALPVQLIKKHYTSLPNVLLYNEYGMTETSVAFSASLINPHEERCLIGTPIDNMKYRVLNKEDGVGELLVSGIGVANGYVNEKCDERFSYYDGIRSFNTGDLVKEDNDGMLIYYGRKDRQVKVNGKRFDLLEISTILKDELNVEAVAILNSRGKIVCFISADDITKMKAEKILLSRIPCDFLPTKYKIVDKIYKLPNGKIDYNMLKEVGER